MQVDALSLADRAWLKMDEPTNPMVITGLLTFAEPLDHAEVVRFTEERLLAEGRFRRRLDTRHSCWTDDDRFDLRSHVHHVALPRPGDDRAIEALVSDLMSTRLDPLRPLWQLHHVDGYAGGSALVFRLHHSIADGVALLRLLGRMVAHEEAPVLRTVHARTDVGRSAVALARLVALRPEPETPLRRSLGLVKRAAFSSLLPLPELTTLAHSAGGTVNDVVATLVAGGLRRWLDARGALRDGLELRAIVPVNLRDGGSDEALGNRFGLVFLPLPLDVAAPRARLAEIVRRTRELKGSPEASVTFGVLGALALAPGPVEDVGVAFFGSKVTLVLTDLPGPREPVTVAGGLVKSIAFWPPQAGRLGLGVSALSYAGQMRIGVASDAGIMEEPREIVAGLEADLEELRRG